MGKRNSSSLIYVVSGLVVAVLAVAGCGQQSSPLSDESLRAGTQVFMAADQYEIRDASIGVATSASAEQNSERAFVPASITKVVTTATALRELGAEFKFKTRISFSASAGIATDVVVVADGDPTAGFETFQAGAPNRMQEIASAFTARGIREIRGPVHFVGLNPGIDSAKHASGVPDEDTHECYGMLASNFNFRENCAVIRSHPQKGFVWENSAGSSGFESQVEKRQGDRTILNLETLFSNDGTAEGFRLTGIYGRKEKEGKSQVMRVPVRNSASWYGFEMLKALRQNRVAVSQATVRVAKSSTEREQAMRLFSRNQGSALLVESAPLSRIIEATNKPSDNFFADAVFKSLARNTTRDAAAESRRVVRDATSDWLQADGHAAWASELQFGDGAGLSIENRATPRAFLAILRQLVKEPTFPTLLESLPLAGIDGTLADRMKNTAAAGRVRAKTGTLKGSYQLAGYIPRQRAGTTEYVPFVILTATTEANRANVRAFQDALVAKMTETIQHEN